MANFNTHIKTDAIVSGLSAAALFSTTHISFNSAVWLWGLGTLGGLLPDIDSDNSTSLDTLFAIFTLAVVLISVRFISAVVFTELRFIELIGTAVVAYSAIKFIIRPLFEKFTVHRGSCHSLLFLSFSALSVTHLTWQFSAPHTQQADLLAWLSGGFVLLGGIIHLLLDEIFSVDLQNIRIKRSFGSAFKVADFKSKTLTLVMLIATLGLIYIAPTSERTINILTDWSQFKL